LKVFSSDDFAGAESHIEMDAFIFHAQIQAVAVRTE